MTDLPDAEHAALFDELTAMVREGRYRVGPELRAALGRLNSAVAQVDRLGRRPPPPRPAA